MNESLIRTQSQDAAWFCVHLRPKHEHIAAAYLRKMDAVEVFFPRIRFKRAMQRHAAWITEALFPGYLFARFDWQAAHRQVQYASGVRGVVQFGEQIPIVPEEIIRDLRRTFGTAEPQTLAERFSVGESIQIAEGALRGHRAVITNIMPARERIEVLMEILGQRTTIQLQTRSVVTEGNAREKIFA